jgi:hypothetical protein
MARKDDIFMSFIKHELIIEKYKINEEDVPHSLKDALKSEQTIIKAIALIVENTESVSPLNDRSLYALMTQYLNLATT